MSSPSPSSGQSPAPHTAALQQLWSAHAAAVFGYPLVGVHLTDAGQITRARTLEQAHAELRDAVAQQLASLGVPLPGGQAVGSAAPIATTAQAHRHAAALEEAVAAACRFLLVRSDQAGRPSALAALITAAKDATYWRALAAPNAPTVPFAGT